MARDRELDLVLVSEKADPPVCRIMDYGKFKFEQEKKAKEAKKKSHQTEVKEVKVPSTRSTSTTTTCGSVRPSASSRRATRWSHRDLPGP